MSDFMGKVIRDRRSGVVGKVIGIVSWLDTSPPSLVVQPPARPDQTVPPTVYVQEPSAELVPQMPEPPVQ